MKKCKWIALFFAVCLLVAVSSGCNRTEEAENTESVPFDSDFYNVSRFFIQYMEYTMMDISKSAHMTYFTDDTEIALYLQSDPTTAYEIIRLEKLSDALWVAEIYSTSAMFPDGMYCVNYIGILDGNMLVYRNLKHIPDSLTEGLEIEEYIAHGPNIVG